jgi:hypothetical protein
VKRPKRGYIPRDGANDQIYWMDNHGTASGDAWVCGDGGWHSRPVMQPCDEYCPCSVEARKNLEELSSEVGNVPQG